MYNKKTYLTFKEELITFMINNLNVIYISCIYLNFHRFSSNPIMFKLVKLKVSLHPPFLGFDPRSFYLHSTYDLHLLLTRSHSIHEITHFNNLESILNEKSHTFCNRFIVSWFLLLYSGKHETTKERDFYILYDVYPGF